MKTSLLIALFFISIIPRSIFAQGALNPTGPPGATMKSLDQIEARTPVSSLPFTISAGGSYYLTKSLSVASGNAVTITADNVTLDLNGFTISSTASPAAGIAVLLSGGRKNVRITNGNIVGSVIFNGSTFTGAGFQHGIVGTTADPIATTVSFVNISGLSGAGIFLGLANSASLIDACNVYTVGGNGLVAVSITNSTAAQCGATAITGHTVENCRGDCVSNGVGINATNATNCYGVSTNNVGVMASNATNCYGANLLGNNLTTTVGVSAATATGCYGTSNAGTGLVADMALNCEAVTAGTINNVTMSVKNAENCYANGATTGAGGYGILATGSVKNCYGIAHFTGIQAQTAEGCTGLTTGSFGIQAQAAANCYGGPASGTASISNGISASTAIGCSGNAGSGGAGVAGNVVSYCFGSGASPAGGGVAGSIVFACLGENFSDSTAYYYFCGNTGPKIFPDSTTF